MTTKHTPGQWLSGRNHRWGRQVFARSSDFGTIIVAHLGDADFDEANAHLIAAAPDLLAALEAMVRSDSWADADVKMVNARAAIAKAKGETK